MTTIRHLAASQSYSNSRPWLALVFDEERSVLEALGARGVRRREGRFRLTSACRVVAGSLPWYLMPQFRILVHTDFIPACSSQSIRSQSPEVPRLEIASPEGGHLEQPLTGSAARRGSRKVAPSPKQRWTYRWQQHWEVGSELHQLLALLEPRRVQSGDGEFCATQTGP